MNTFSAICNYLFARIKIKRYLCRRVFITIVQQHEIYKLITTIKLMSMKKIFTLAAASLIAMSASADNVVTKLDKNYVIYMTNDTTTSKMQIVEDEETGEEVEKQAPVYWTGGDMVNAFNKCGMPLTGTSSTQTQYKFTVRNDYKDAKTGFDMPAGAYRGIFVDGTIDIKGAIGENNLVGFSNIKSVVLYFAPIPQTWVPTMGISHQDYPTGRVQAKYVDADGNAISNQSYREAHINQSAGATDSDAQIIKNTDILNFYRAPEKPLEITIDQPYKVEVNLQNKLDGTDYNELFQNPTNKQSEYANFICEKGTTEGEMSYYFAETGKCPYSYDNEGSGDSASGYDCFNQKWGPKVAWTPETIVQFGIKKRMYLFGIAIVSATEGAASQFMNANEGLDATWKSKAKAYGVYGTTGIESVAADKAQQLQAVYNIAGQQVGKSFKGIVIKNGKKYIQ